MQNPHTKRDRKNPDLLVTCSLANKVLRYDGQTGALKTSLDPEGHGKLFFPQGIAQKGNEIFVAAFYGSNILKYDGTSGVFLKYAVEGIRGPSGISWCYDGNLYLITENPRVIVRCDFLSGGQVFAGNVADIPLPAYDLTFSPMALANPPGPFPPHPDPSIRVDVFMLVSCTDNNQILSYPMGTLPNLNPPPYAASTFVHDGPLNGPTGLIFGPDNDLYVSNSKANNILRYDGTGNFKGIYASGGGLNRPVGLSFGPDGDLYVASNNSNQILRYQGPYKPNPGQFIDVFATGAQGPAFLTFYPI